MAVQEGIAIITRQPAELFEVEGVNNRVQLAALERAHQTQIANELMLSGASLADPARSDVRGKLNVESDVKIDVNCLFEGQVSLGKRVRIGPHCVLKNCSIADDTVVEAFSHIEESEIGAAATIGPYARLRPGTKLAEKAKIGNFVEIKKAVIGTGSKVNHLSYIGDANVGNQVNIGAGTITCNYDGVNKFVTNIKDDVFVGSNTALVAPVTLAKGTTVGAGSIITKDVDENQLAISRTKQRNLSDWQRPEKNK